MSTRTVDRPTGGQQLICVTGMHRSGTSALTRILGVLGVDLGEEAAMIQALPDNPEGFWEQRSIVDFDERLLRHHGGTWSDPPFMDVGWAGDPGLDGHRRDAAALLDATLGVEGTVGWKDPRTSLLLPFWRTVEVVPPTIHVVRDPQEVAGSLAKRDRFHPERSAYLWLRHVVAVCRDDPRAVTVLYTDVLQRPVEVARRIVAAYDLAVPDAVAEAEIAGTIRPELRRAARVGDGPIMAVAEEVHRVLVEGDADGLAERCEELHGRWRAAAGMDRRVRAVQRGAYALAPQRLLDHQPFRTRVGGVVGRPLQRATLDEGSAEPVAGTGAGRSRRATEPLVAVGGLGGSSTRAVARCLIEAGVDMGSDLNVADDDLLFTLLFKRPAWLRRRRLASGEDVQAAVATYMGLRLGRRPRPVEVPRLLAAAAAEVVSGYERPAAHQRVVWAGRRLAAAFAGASGWSTDPSSTGGSRRWGWKEPNTWLYLDEVVRQAPGIAYVHVVRHGLDMAHSPNTNQLRTWGGLFGLDPSAEDPATALEMWIRANGFAIERARHLLGARVLVLDVDAFCADPVEGVATLLDFLDLQVDEATRERMAAIPRTPASTGRYRELGLEAFAPEQIAAVESLGFTVHR